MDSFPNFEPVHCSMSGSNCCFLTNYFFSGSGLLICWSHYIWRMIKNLHFKTPAPPRLPSPTSRWWWPGCTGPQWRMGRKAERWRKSSSARPAMLCSEAGNSSSGWSEERDAVTSLVRPEEQAKGTPARHQLPDTLPSTTTPSPNFNHHWVIWDCKANWFQLQTDSHFWRRTWGKE